MVYHFDNEGVPGQRPLSISEVQAWETEPAEEKTYLMAFIGREVERYITRLIDPKE
jgi:hypothetical protein